LGERFNGIEEVVGSIPSGSTKYSSIGSVRRIGLNPGFLVSIHSAVSRHSTFIVEPETSVPSSYSWAMVKSRAGIDDDNARCRPRVQSPMIDFK
jgi:hypothetical protein